MQNFNPAVPGYKANLSSDDMRNQLVSLDGCHSGTSSPPHPQEGKFWFKTDDLALYQYMFGDWRMLFKYNPLTGKIEVEAGEIMSKSDYILEEPSGTKDGANTTFTLLGGRAYVPGTLSVLLNGQQYNPTNIQQNAPLYKTFTIVGDTIPISTDVLTITYLKS